MGAIRKILIANRGEIARRITRTCRAMGIDVVAIFADPDRQAPFVREADEAVYIGAPLASASFLAIDKLIDAARKTGADAVHPGYGFLAENADFAQACTDAGLRFIGPSPDAIRRMGSKIVAKQMAVAASVPVIPGFSAEGLSEREIEERAGQLSYPILIKASAGGGGKGMRIVRAVKELPAALAAARREAQAAFGDDTLLVERYFDSPRHIEIQILGDTHGNLIHCFERECSIQRRYQKIIEEAPSPAVDAALRQRMCAAALALARALHYSNAGTVEFVVDQFGDFYFLEVNTRLQVEHPVTEMITGLDLVQLQIAVAAGDVLPLRQDDLAINGHAIECRVYAEDPRADFLPSIGRIACWEEVPLAGVRYESGVETGSEVTIHYDPMLAKVIAHGATRAQATRRLAKALRDLRADGVRTNVRLLLAILEHREFLAGHLDTHFLDTHMPLPDEATEEEIAADRLHGVALALWLQAHRRATAPVLRTIPSGWRNNPSRMQDIVFNNGQQDIRVEYRLLPRDEVDLAVDGTPARGKFLSIDGNQIELVIDEVLRRYQVVDSGERFHVHSQLGSSELREVPRFPTTESDETSGGCRAPMPGKVLAVHVEPGRRVKKGETLVILEAMKMEHAVVAPHDGVVEAVLAEPGRQVDAGTVLVVLAEDTTS